MDPNIGDRQAARPVSGAVSDTEVAPAVRTVKDYLAANARRDPTASRSYLAQGAALVFPEGAFDDPAQIHAGARRRYQEVAKSFERWFHAETPEGYVVEAIGTLHGVALDGTPFDGVRFIDRFELDGEGRIVRVDVFNDLAERGVVVPPSRGHHQEGGA